VRRGPVRRESGYWEPGRRGSAQWQPVYWETAQTANAGGLACWINRNTGSLIPKLQLGNSALEAPASRLAKLELRLRGSQAGAWEPVRRGPGCRESGCWEPGRRDLHNGNQRIGSQRKQRMQAI